MTQTQLLNEFRQYSAQQQLEIIQAALRILTEHLQLADFHTNGTNGHQPLTEAAALLLSDYREDHELIGFTALDGEPFYAEG